MRNMLIAGNWKMNKDIHETATLVNEIKEMLKDVPADVGIVVCPPAPSLVVAATLLKGTSVHIGAQNVSERDDGAFTGEVSARMLKAVGCEYVIIGHSERRQYFGETDDLINAKARKALGEGLKPIICVGETLDERESNITDKVITAQVNGVLRDLSTPELERIIVAYEPVWAIGTGKTATPDQANRVHQLIRRLVAQMHSWAIAERLVIQYGGSVNASNAFELLSQSDIDGALVGGASLKSDSFLAILRSASDAGKR